MVGSGTVTELLKRGHEVVLVSRHASEESKQWPAGIHPCDVDVCDAGALQDVGAGCDVVLHVVGIVDEAPPEATFERVNVQGTRNMLALAERQHIPRFIFVSSLGAPTGKSGYHQSKRKAELAVESSPLKWVIVRPGNVYGPGDEQISILLRMVRGVSPLVPTVGDGQQQFQPIWWEDVAEALANICEREDVYGRAIELAGPEVTSQTDLLERMSAITGRNVHTIALPPAIASLGAKIVSSIGWDVPLSDDQVDMLDEGNVIAPGSHNALPEFLDRPPTPINDALRMLTELQPEQLPTEGVGALKRKRFWADIDNVASSPEQLFTLFCKRFAELTPVFVEVGAEPAGAEAIEEGETLTLALPMRGHVQVRVEELTPRSVTLITLAGHPLAGAVRFLVSERAARVRFEVEVYDRAANALDLLAMRSIGDRLQKHTWTKVVENVIAASGGQARAGVEHEGTSLTEEEAGQINTWLSDLTMSRKREENTERINEPV